MNHRIPGVIICLVISLYLTACQVSQNAVLPMTLDAIIHDNRSALIEPSDTASVYELLAKPTINSSTSEAPSILTITLPETQPAGTAISVDALLINLDGEPQTNKVLNLHLNGEQVRRMRTDDMGRASLYLGRELPTGNYQVEVLFEGTEAYKASSATGMFEVRPAVLTIRTVPLVEKIGIAFDDQIGYTNEDGVVHFEVPIRGTYGIDLLPLPEPGIDIPMLVQFERWADGVFFPHREVLINGDKELLLGLGLSHQIGVTFVDLAGRAVDPSRISSFTLKSSHGTRFTYTNGYPRWLKANRVARLINGLEATEIQYAVENVIVDGTNVVNQNQQRFLVTKDETWPVELLLYSAHIQVRDAIFGFPLATEMDMLYPDEQVKTFPLDENSEVYIDSLARGEYTIQAKGVGGVAPETPVSLSRDQDVVLKVLSTFDMGVGLGLGAIIALGLLLYGRPRLISAPTAALAGLIGMPRQRRRIQPGHAAFQRQAAPGKSRYGSGAGVPSDAVKHRT